MRSSRCPLVACSDVMGSSVTDILVWQMPPKRSDAFQAPSALTAWLVVSISRSKERLISRAARAVDESRDGL
jgi:hypothetical protein